MTITAPRRFVTVRSPSPTAGVGSALRQAFKLPRGDGTGMFDKLIERLDQVG